MSQPETRRVKLSEPERPFVSVIVPLLNALSHLQASIGSMVAAVESYGEAELIVVDNGSTDGSVEYLRECFGSRLTLTSFENSHVGAVRNHGVELARGHVVCFIDADCVVGSDYISTAVRVLRVRGADVTGSWYELPDEPLWIEDAWHAMHAPWGDGDINFINAGNLVCLRTAFDAVGGFDSRLQTGEDAELCARFNASGFRVFQALEVRAVHLGNPKSLRAFFWKQVWHGMGALGTFRHDWRDKPLLMTLLHALMSGGGVIFVIVTPGWPSIGSLLLLTSVAPAASVAFRMFRQRRGVPILQGLLLYWVFYVARLVSLGRLLVVRDR